MGSSVRPALGSTLHQNSTFFNSTIRHNGALREQAKGVPHVCHLALASPLRLGEGVSLLLANITLSLDLRGCVRRHTKQLCALLRSEHRLTSAQRRYNIYSALPFQLSCKGAPESFGGKPEISPWSKERHALRSRYIRLAHWNSSRSNTLACTISVHTSLVRASLAGMDFLSFLTACSSWGNTWRAQKTTRHAWRTMGSYRMHAAGRLRLRLGRFLETRLRCVRFDLQKPRTELRRYISPVHPWKPGVLSTNVPVFAPASSPRPLPTPTSRPPQSRAQGSN